MLVNLLPLQKEERGREPPPKGKEEDRHPKGEMEDHASRERRPHALSKRRREHHQSWEAVPDAFHHASFRCKERRTEKRRRAI